MNEKDKINNLEDCEYVNEFHNASLIIVNCIKSNYPTGINPVVMSHVLCQLGIEIMKKNLIEKEKCKSQFTKLVEIIYE